MNNNTNDILISPIFELVNHIKERLDIISNEEVKVTKANILESEKGTNSGSIYRVEYLDKKAILKTGVRDIEKVSETMDFIRKNHPELESEGNLILPTIVGQLNNDFYELLPLAKGSSFTKLWAQYFNNEINGEYLQKCYGELGNTLSDIHLTSQVSNTTTNLAGLRTSLIHGDLNRNNMFCNIDKESKNTTVTLIDNGRMADSIENPLTVENDLRLLIEGNLPIDSLFNKNTAENIRKEEMQMFVSFLKGYSSNIKNIDFDNYLSSIFTDEVDNLYFNSRNPVFYLLGALTEGIVAADIGEDFLPPLQRDDMIFNILGEVFPDREFADDFI